jgi:prephenate dehydrogenase
MLVAFLGFGLIGGSVARALRGSADAGDLRIVAWTPTSTGPRTAVADGILDAAASSPVEAITGADLIVLAAPPLDCLALLDHIGGSWHAAVAPEAVITDVASTKGAIVERADALGLRFVGGHPMAGREVAGYVASTAELLHDRPWVVVPGAVATEDDIRRVEWLASACGAVPMAMTADAHDAAVAGTSHLPLVLSAALVQAVTAGGLEPDLTAGGWRDMTRLARGDVTMGTGIAATNAPALASRIRDLLDVLETWLADLEATDGPDVPAISERLRSARAQLEALD